MIAKHLNLSGLVTWCFTFYCLCLQSTQGGLLDALGLLGNTVQNGGQTVPGLLNQVVGAQNNPPQVLTQQYPTRPQQRPSLQTNYGNVNNQNTYQQTPNQGGLNYLQSSNQNNNLQRPTRPPFHPRPAQNQYPQGNGQNYQTETDQRFGQNNYSPSSGNSNQNYEPTSNYESYSPNPPNQNYPHNTMPGQNQQTGNGGQLSSGGQPFNSDNYNNNQNFGGHLPPIPHNNDHSAQGNGNIDQNEGSRGQTSNKMKTMTVKKVLFQAQPVIADQEAMRKREANVTLFYLELD